MNDADLLRYSRHILLDEFGVEGQERVCAAHALIIGAGGLGSPVALYLAAAGVGRITLVDHDHVDLTNLQRQIAHTTARAGQPKVASAAEAMRAINPQIAIDAVAVQVDAAWLDEHVPGVDVVIDCCDNFETRQRVNRACVEHAVTLVSGAAIRFDGQLLVRDPDDHNAPCYACAFPPDLDVEETRCAVMGVFAPVVAVIGSLQANEALKAIAGLRPTCSGRLLLFDGRSTRFDSIVLRRDPLCPVCGSASTHAT